MHSSTTSCVDALGRKIVTLNSTYEKKAFPAKWRCTSRLLQTSHTKKWIYTTSECECRWVTFGIFPRRSYFCAGLISWLTTYMYVLGLHERLAIVLVLRKMLSIVLVLRKKFTGNGIVENGVQHAWWNEFLLRHVFKQYKNCVWYVRGQTLTVLHSRTRACEYASMTSTTRCRSSKVSTPRVATRRRCLIRRLPEVTCWM